VGIEVGIQTGTLAACVARILIIFKAIEIVRLKHFILNDENMSIQW